jgi:hypothetical protein
MLQKLVVVKMKIVAITKSNLFPKKRQPKKRCFIWIQRKIKPNI